METETTEHGVAVHGAEGKPHPTPKQYIVVAIILAGITLAEVGLYYMKLASPLLITLLLFFSALKFALVVLWFMHLRFDSRLFRRLFATGLVLAGIVYTIVLSTFLLR